MIKKFFTAGIVLFFLAILIIPSVTHGQAGGPGLPGMNGVNPNAGDFSIGNYIFDGIAKGIGQALMSFSAGILAIVGVFFDTVIKVTIIDMATNIGNPQGLGGSITSVWATLRDISNMAFIFVLLFTAFKAMFELNFGSVSTTIRNIIIVALFINFSLFGTKVVIDASNIVAIGFYNSIRTGNSAQFNSGTGGPINFQGISGGYMRLIGLQSWFSSGILGSGNGLGAPQILLIGLMSSIFMFVTAIIFLISGVMFLSRFIILILVMVTAAPACVCYIIPGQKGHFDKWVETLKSQAAFAPIFFAMTWVTFRLASSPQFLGTLTLSSVTGGAGPVKDFTNIISQSPSSVSSAGLILNFMIVMGLAVASLVFSKSVASKAAGFTAISGAVGTTVIGGAAFAGRQGIGRASKWVSDTQRESWSKSTAGRAGLWLANKGSNSTFDIRASDKLGKIPGLGSEMGIIGKAGGKGGFAGSVEEKAKAKAKYAKDVYGQTDEEKEALKEAKDAEKKDVIDKRQARVDVAALEATDAERARKTHFDAELRDSNTEINQINTQRVEKSRELARAGGNKVETDRISKELEQINLNLTNARKAKEDKQKEIEESGTYKVLKKTADDTKSALQEANNKLKSDIKDDDEDLSQATRDLATAGKRRQQEYAKRIRGESPISTGTGALVGGVAGGATIAPLIGGVLGGIAGPIGVAAGAAAGAAIGKAIGGNIRIQHQGSKAAARKIVEQAEGKSPKDKAADILKDLAKDGVIGDTATAAVTPPATPPSASGDTTT